MTRGSSAQDLAQDLLRRLRRTAWMTWSAWLPRVTWPLSAHGYTARTHGGSPSLEPETTPGASARACC